MSSTVTNGKFIGLSDFYNYIKQSDGQNSPTNFYYFSVWFYPEGGTSYFSGVNLDRLRYAVQKVELPKSILKGYENNQLVDATSSIDNLYGAYTFLRNSYFNTDSKTISIRFLNFQLPVIEQIIYPWYYNCVKNEWDTVGDYGTSFPKLSMVIRFWSGNNVSAASSSTSSHVFEYFVSGLFPITIEPYSPAQAAGSDDNRTVTFAFNEFRAYIKGYESTYQQSIITNPLSTPISIQKQPQTPGTTPPGAISAKSTGTGQTGQGQTLDGMKRAQEQAAQAAAAAQKKQNVEAHNWLQNMVANAAGATAGSVVKKSVTNNLISQLKNESSKKNSSNGSNSSNNQMTIKDAQEKASTVKENENNVKQNQGTTNLTDKTNDVVNSGNMGSLTVDQVVNILNNNEKNVSSNDSNMTLPENEMLVESMNVDNDFGLILDDTDESEQAFAETTDYATEQTEVTNNVNKELTQTDQVKSNPKTFKSVDNLSINDNVKTEKKEETSIKNIDTTSDKKQTSNNGLSKDDLNNYSSEKEKTEKKEESKLSDDDITNEKKTSNNDDSSKSNLNISDIVKSFNDNKNLKSKEDLTDVSTDMLNTISNNLSLGEISGSIDNMQKTISSYGSNLDVNDVSDRSNENEKESSSIKSNLTLAESKTIVENISVDDEFGEILDSDNELESATEERKDEYKKQNAIGIEKTIEEIQEILDTNNEKLKTYVSESDLNLNKIKENYDMFLTENDVNKNKVIQTKKEELDNYTTETTNEVKTDKVNLSIDDVRNNSIDSINKMKNESDLNLDTIKENYDTFIAENTTNKNKVIQTKKEELDNYTTNDVSTNKNKVIQTKKEELDNYTTETTNEVKYRKVNDDTTSSSLSSSFKEIESLKTSKNLNEKPKLKTLENNFDNKKSTSNIAKEYIEAVTTSKPNELEIGRSKLPEYIKVRDDYYERLILATETIKENIDHIMNIIRRMDEEFGIILDTNELEEVNNMFKDLQNNKRISVISYKHLNTYAENENLDITDVTKDYKSKSGSELDSFIDDIIMSNIRYEKNTITNSGLNATIFLKDEQIGFKKETKFQNIPQVNNTERIKEYNAEKMLSNDDINDLFN